MKQTILGMGALMAAVLTTSDWIETSLLRQGAGTLGWGPGLFRFLLGLHGIVLVIAGQTPRRKTGTHPVIAPMSRGTWWALAALSVTGLVLRLWRLDSCLWLDEVLTLVGFARLPVNDIVSRFPDQNQHMLYSLAARASFAIFGEHAWSLRLPSVLFGVGSIWALFLLGRRLVGTRESLLACALMTVSYHHVWFSQNARGYMGLLFFSTLATWLWVEARVRPGRSLWGAYAISLALGMWLHMTMVFVPAAHFIVWAFGAARAYRKQDRIDWRPLAAWALGATLTLQLLSLSLPEFLRSALHEASNDSEWTRPAWVLAEMLRSLRVGFSGGAALAAGAAVALAGWISLARRQAAAAMSMTLPAVIGGVLMIAVSHNIWPRFFFFSMGFALLIAVHGAFQAPRLLLGDRPIAARLGMAAVCLLTAASAFTLPRCYALPKQDFTGARDYLARSLGRDVPVASAGLATLVYRGYYAPEWLAASSVEELDALRRRHPDLALVYTLPPQLKAFDPALWRVIESDFEIVKVFPGTLGGGEVYVGRPRLSVTARAN